VGHATFCVVVVYNNALARLRRIPPSQAEAAMDLGASPLLTFRDVLLPHLRTALLAGGMLAFALSFDEIIVTTFTAGQQETLPIWIFNQLTKPRQRPVTNVVAGSIFTFSLTMGDFVVPGALGDSSLYLGQAVLAYQGTAGNIPLAAAFTAIPVMVMAAYLVAARRLGAFDAL